MNNMDNVKNTEVQNKYYDAEMINIILEIPKNTASLTVNAVILDDNDKPITATAKYVSDDIRQMRQDFLDNVDFGDDYNVRFVATEKGLEYLEQLKNQGRN